MLKVTLLALALGAPGYLLEKGPNGDLYVIEKVDVDVTIGEGQCVLVLPREAEEDYGAAAMTITDADGVPQWRLQGGRIEPLGSSMGEADRIHYLKRRYKAAREAGEKAAIVEKILGEPLEAPEK